MREALESHAARLAASAPVRGSVEVLLDQLRVSARTGREWRDEAYYDLMARMDKAVVALGAQQSSCRRPRRSLGADDRVRRMASKSPARLLVTIAEHTAILMAIRDGDAEAAANSTRLHVQHSLPTLPSHLAWYRRRKVAS